MSDSTSEPAARPVYGMSPRRLEAFSDGVFAIVITLLVLELHLPAGDELLGTKLWSIWPKIAA